MHTSTMPQFQYLVGTKATKRHSNEQVIGIPLDTIDWHAKQVAASLAVDVVIKCRPPPDETQ